MDLSWTHHALETYHRKAIKDRLTSLMICSLLTWTAFGYKIQMGLECEIVLVMIVLESAWTSTSLSVFNGTNADVSACETDVYIS